MATHLRRWPIVLAFALMASLLTWVTATVVELPAPARAAASGSLTGLVFEDYDVDGTRDGGEPGVAGVTVRAYDSSGALVATTTSATNGTYTLVIASAATNDVRVEFDTPAGFQPSFVGTNAGPSVQFTTVSAVNVNYAVQDADSYCQANPMLFGSCYYPGATSWNGTEGTLQKTPWQTRGGAATDVLTKAVTGAIWGVATHYQHELVYTSAVIRRHSALGPQGLGGLYVTTTNGALVASWDLEALYPSVVSLSAGTDYSDAARGITANNYSHDLPGWAGVGTEGIGDIDITPDGRYMYLTNLHKRSVIQIEIGGTAVAPTLGTATEFLVPDLCPVPGEQRPWGLEIEKGGTVLVGMACSDIKTYTGALAASDPETLELPDDAVIGRLDPTPGAATPWDTVTTISFDYPRQTDWCTGAGVNTSVSAATDAECAANRWHPWTNDWTNIKTLSFMGSSMYLWPQPMIMDIETLDDGSLVVGLNDRTSMQIGKNFEPVAASTVKIYSWVHGELLLLCKAGNGYTQESGGNCAGDTSYTSNSQNPTYEFFTDLVHHQESAQGGIAVNPYRGDTTIAQAIMDPATINSSGIIFNSTVDGSKNGTGVDWISRADGDGDAGNVGPAFGSFQKSSSMGDMEVLCDLAPVQIGDRLWYDTDGDGIQDAGELPVVGATVRLYDATGTNVIGTAITDANGRYLFSSTVVEASAGDGDSSGGGLTTGVGYVIRLDNPADYSSGGPLDGYQLTTPNAAGGTRIDSNAATTNGYPQITVASLTPGANNHTYDAGFVRTPVPPAPQVPLISQPVPTPAPPAPAPRVSVGDYVWVDVNGDGRQDVGEPPIAGVTLTITNPDGSRVRDVNGRLVGPTTTDANGRYSFDDLPPGDYVVRVQAPAGYEPTVAGVGGREGDSSTGTARSRQLTRDGDRDDTLDFGFVPARVSVGRYVWVDRDGNGRQDPGEEPIPGVRLELRDMNGNPVLDVFGNPVGPQITDANGEYLFADLPPGQYQVFIAYPPGYGPTVPGVGDGSADSSSFVAIARALGKGEADLTLDFGVVPMDMNLPATGTEGRSTGLVALMLLGVGLVALLASNRRRRSEA